jgi:hypothetical protein
MGESWELQGAKVGVMEKKTKEIYLKLILY